MRVRIRFKESLLVPCFKIDLTKRQASRAPAKPLFGTPLFNIEEGVKKLVSSTFVPEGQVDFRSFRMRSLRLRVICPNKLNFFTLSQRSY
jgi:hypothetical protein